MYVLRNLTLLCGKMYQEGTIRYEKRILGVYKWKKL